ncbi:hypothetical protein CR919_14980 [Stenotrophomonas sp. LMG 10879]|uniref:hypothetical protein n=1 Tax=Stenotrophomonas sp. LMG 10879 TaxID=487706 RepID=UPI000C176569|nr:hypothetical protein [Stenotrophomonas sp. LMG 10879]PII18990.1 hypothetical protein CR919_14980 [Stenotrophomonas sp. LMG 10879]
MQLDTFGVYVRAELEHWGREFALHRDRDYLGHHSRNILQVLIEHNGDLAGRPKGNKPIETDARAQRIEDIITSIGRDSIAIACCLRAYHCGVGRRKVERFETALELLANCSQKAVSNRQYLILVELGFQRVRGRLEGHALAA